MHTVSADSVWEARRAAAADTMISSAIRELLKLTELPNMISFAGGLPAPECFPAEEIGLATERVLSTQATRALQYGPTPGMPALRAFCADLVAGRGLRVSADDVLITSGSQQALDVLGKLLIDPGDLVLVEDPTYLGALQAWRPYRPRFFTLPIDDEGLQVDALAETLRRLDASGERPKFLYTVSNFQNPTGVTLSAARRQALLDVAEQYHLPIVEDDPYGELRYSGEAIPPLAALDVERHGEPHHVVYLSTFSKLLAPGLRIGWVTAPRWMLRRIEQVKEGIDLHTGSLAQAIAYETCRDGLLTRHIPRIRSLYKQRRDVMLQALSDHMPDTVRWTRPDGGMFLWLTLPEQYDTMHVLNRAVEQKVAFVPGEAFHANGGGRNSMRLNFSYSSHQQLQQGIERLAHVLSELRPEDAS